MNEFCLIFVSPGICNFFLTYPILWFFFFCWLAWMFVTGIIKISPDVESIWAKILLPVAGFIQFKFLTRAAIAADIKGNVNAFVSELKSELPFSWFPVLDIDWIQEETVHDFFSDDMPVLRMRPIKNQDSNFAIGVHRFIGKNLFPITKQIIPVKYRDAAVLELGRRLIQTRRPSLRQKFDDEILEPAIKQNSELLEYLDRYHALDTRGFFTGSFLREIHTVATDARFLPIRKNLDDEIELILKHNEDFLKKYIAFQAAPLGYREPMPDALWSKRGAATNYSFLLVAQKLKANSGQIRVYVNKAAEKLASGVERLYVFGASSEKWFARAVINTISERVPGFKLVGKFRLPYDYRGDKGGMGALFVKKD